jgi:hypothetical protein
MVRNFIALSIRLSCNFHLLIMVGFPLFCICWYFVRSEISLT